MHTTIIENTTVWRIDSVNSGWAYEFTHKPTGKTAFIQDNEASMWRDDYEKISQPDGPRSTRAYRFTWDEILDELCFAYLPD